MARLGNLASGGSMFCVYLFFDFTILTEKNAFAVGFERVVVY